MVKLETTFNVRALDIYEIAVVEKRRVKEASFLAENGWRDDSLRLPHE